MTTLINNQYSYRKPIKEHMHETTKSRDAIIIPAYNEEKSIGCLIDELREYVPHIDVILINDGSVDETANIGRNKNVIVLNLPCNLGVGGAVQVGLKYTLEKGYRFVIRIDGDGQHPPSEIPKLIKAMRKGDTDLIIGSRFSGGGSYVNTPIRSIGIKLLALFLSVICRHRISDPTSGFWIINRPLLNYLAHNYPSDYPEPEAIALLTRHGYSYREEPVVFRRRTGGVSSIQKLGTIYYVLKVGLALVVDRIKPVNKRFEKKHLNHNECF
jgi:glycosyltransferase involved in cell wall biosynthesis